MSQHKHCWEWNVNSEDKGASAWCSKGGRCRQRIVLPTAIFNKIFHLGEKKVQTALRDLIEAKRSW